MAAPAACLDVLCAAGLFGCQCQPVRPANANANASSSSKINHLQGRVERPHAEGGRELFSSPSRAYPEAWWLVSCLLVSYRPLAHI